MLTLKKTTLVFKRVWFGNLKMSRINYEKTALLT